MHRPYGLSVAGAILFAGCAAAPAAAPATLPPLTSAASQFQPGNICLIAIDDAVTVNGDLINLQTEMIIGALDSISSPGLTNGGQATTQDRNQLAQDLKAESEDRASCIRGN